MRLFSTFCNSTGILFLLLPCLFLGTMSHAQQTTMKDFVVFSGNGTCKGGQDQKPPLSPGYAVQLGNASIIQGGSVGSYRLVKSTGNATFNANIYCGGTIQLSKSNTVTGSITAANTAALTGNILSAGPYATLGGNINVNGNIFISGGTVGGTVRHPAGTTYSGPLPAGGEETAPPRLPILPLMPDIKDFPACPHIPDINSTTIIKPGVYGDIKFRGNKTLTFNGPGVYVFDKIDNSGGFNYFVFDFKNDPSGTFKIYVHRDADAGKIITSMVNGGSATRIFTEIHGNGSTCNNGKWAFNIDNGPSGYWRAKWLGTVWAPFGGINIGSGSGNSKITGALWSGTQVNVQCGATIIYAPYSECNTPDVNAGPDKPLDFEHPVILTGSSATPGVTFNWKADNGGAITPPANQATITVSVAGRYILTVTSTAGCTATDTVSVTGKTNNLVGSELQSVIDNFNPDDPPSDFFVLQHDSIMIDVIAKEGMYSKVLELLTSPAYGLSNVITNGSSNFIITGLFPISNLPSLNTLDSLIVYCRPFYGAFSNAGIVTSAGDTSMRSDLVRNGYNLGGEGVKVGVISDSYNTIASASTNPVTNTAAQDVGNGDLPGAGNPDGDIIPVHVLQDYPVVRSDEGRAMLQIVHDIAPKAELYFRTGFISAGDFAEGIGALNQAGCNIILDDVTYITEPFLKDGVVAAAVDAVAAKGTTYFSAAGNFGNKSYENTYNPVPAPGGIKGTAHNFAGNGQTDIFQSVTLSPGNYVIVLQWVDDIYSLGQTSSGGTKNDLDLYLTPNTDGTALFGFNRNNINGDPIEILPFAITSTVQTNIMITNNTVGSKPARFKYIVFKGNIAINEYTSGTSTIVGQANAAGAIAVGAARYDKVFPFPFKDSVESFSSTGGTFVDGIQRNKPDLVAPDGVNTTVNLGPDYNKDPYSNFFGTSAAVPHAAGVAALIMEGRKKYLNQPVTTPAEIMAILQSSATNMYTPGFDFTSGYGFINADSAMRTFARPRPAINELVYPSTVIPGAASFTLTIRSKNLSYNSVVRIRDSSLATTVLNPEEATVQIPPFFGNPAISIYTPPISLSNQDGGYSDSLYFLNTPKKNIIVTVENKSKKYGEKMPELTASILIDSIAIQNTTFKPADLGLDSLTFTTLASTTSDVGTYRVTPSRLFDPSDPIARGLSELYTYTFHQGDFTIIKLPLSVTPKDATVTYGEKIPAIQFTYQFDGANIPDSLAFLNNIEITHEGQLAKDGPGNDILGLVNGRAVSIVNGRAVSIVNGRAVSIVNGRAVSIVNGRAVSIVNGQALTIVNGIVTDTSGVQLTPVQLEKLSFLVSAPALQNAREIKNNTLVNGSYTAGSTKVVDITQESILDFNVNSAQTYMLNSLSGVSPKGLVDIETIANGRAVSIVNGEEATEIINGQPVTIVNGRAVSIVNGQDLSIVNGRAVSIVNGQAVTFVNGQAVPIETNQNRTAVVIDSSEIGQGQQLLKSMNMLTGLDAGEQFIIPGALVNNNFEITYGSGKLTILPAPLTIKASDTTKVYGETISLNPAAFTITPGTLMYEDSIQRITLSSAGAGAAGTGGTHPIVPSNAVGGPGTNLTNYAITYVNGVLTVSKAHVIVKANNAHKIYGDANPRFTASFTGLVNGQSFAASGITGNPEFSTTATINSCVGNYPIIVTQGSLLSSDYSFSFSDGTLTICRANLNVKAGDKVIDRGDALPTFTSKIIQLKAGDNPGVSYTISPACVGAPGVYTIIPLLKPFANSKNYTISYTNGKLYINPKGWEAKKLRLYLDCVEAVSADRYIAHFHCINDNRTPVYVPDGVDNKLSSVGTFDGSSQPFLFIPGTTWCNIPFDGSSLKWELRTYECYIKTSSSVSAGPSSARCNVYTAGRSASANVSASKVKEPLTDGAPGIIPSGNVNVFPNPAVNRAIIYISNEVISEKGLSLYDNHGKYYPLKMVRQISGHAVEIDLSRLISGMYFIRVKVEKGYKTISVIKE